MRFNGRVLFTPDAIKLNVCIAVHICAHVEQKEFLAQRVGEYRRYRRSFDVLYASELEKGGGHKSASIPGGDEPVSLTVLQKVERYIY